MGTEELRVTAVTVCWNDAAGTLRCVDSIRASDWPHLDLLVIDNGSSSDTFQHLSRGLEATPLIRLSENTGYTGGFNAGIERAVSSGADFVVLINSDAVIAPDAISRIVRVAQDQNDAALIGAVILTESPNEVILSAGGHVDQRLNPVHDRMGEPRPDVDELSRAVDFVSGCVVMARVSALLEIGLLDSDFFAYYEDIDWCLRARHAGYGVYIAPAALAWHPDTRLRDEQSAAVTYYMARNSLLLATKHAPFQLPAVWFRLARTALSWTIRPRWRRRRAQRDALVRALFDAPRGYRGPWKAPALNEGKAL